MKRVSITQAKNNLSALIEGLKGGSPVLILDRGRPVARLEPIINLRDLDPQGRLERLVRDGIVTPARAKLPRSFFRKRKARLKGNASVVEALLEERREGR
jgi:prevent-host-death family protein